MAPQYRIVTKTAAGVKLADITDYLDLAYVKRVNTPGMCQFRLGGNHPAISSLELNSQIEIYRRDPEQDIDWYADFYGLWRGQEQYNDEAGQEYFIAYCPGQMDMLAWRHVLWYAGTASRTEFTSAKAETILKTLVSYNAGANATTGNSRLRTGTITGISIESDGATGNTISWSCSYKNLLEQLQEIARIAGGDFDLVKTGAQAWEFRWYAGQLGTDRSTSVTFALEYGNMAMPRYRYLRMDEKTVALVGGGGDLSTRTTRARTGPDYNASTNNVEAFVDGRNDGTDTGKLDSRGDAFLDTRRALQEFKYKPLQTPSCLYGKHYFVGDLVKARYKSVEVTQQVYEAKIKFDRSGKQDIAVDMRDL